MGPKFTRQRLEASRGSRCGGQTARFDVVSKWSLPVMRRMGILEGQGFPDTTGASSWEGNGQQEGHEHSPQS